MSITASISYDRGSMMQKMGDGKGQGGFSTGDFTIMGYSSDSAFVAGFGAQTTADVFYLHQFELFF